MAGVVDANMFRRKARCPEEFAPDILAAMVTVRWDQVELAKKGPDVSSPVFQYLKSNLVLAPRHLVVSRLMS